MYPITTRCQESPLMSFIDEQRESITTKGCYNRHPLELRFSEDVELKKLHYPSVYAEKNIDILDSEIDSVFYQGIAKIFRSKIEFINTIDNMKESLSKRNTSGMIDAEDSSLAKLYSGSVACRHCDIKIIHASHVALIKTKVSRITVKKSSAFDETIVTDRINFSGEKLCIKNSKINKIIVETVEDVDSTSEPIIYLINSVVKNITFINMPGKAYLHRNSHIKEISGGTIIQAETTKKREHTESEMSTPTSKESSRAPISLKKRWRSMYEAMTS